ncbi:hypothetical protein F3087_28995 [Nocardia colli]|uniref:Uncharacterized protein n=1 Tax=Nocardia colli TaxID=2545717 RepID=A0A5N0EE34_9NOCA|nr:hypothetical protein [Nocardia colli]KAA8885671.1 hypothetical protein F3087_28995 [Nocardia colli]
MLAYFAVIAILAGALLGWANAQPRAVVSSEEGTSAPAALPPGQASAHFPPAEVAAFRAIVQDTLADVQAGRQSEAKARIKDLETGWDRDQSTLQPLDESGWQVLDGQIDNALKAVRAGEPDTATETTTLTAVLIALG